jgi:hypothetical protein
VVRRLSNPQVSTSNPCLCVRTHEISGANFWLETQKGEILIHEDMSAGVWRLSDRHTSTNSNREAPVITGKVSPDLTTRVLNIVACQKNAFQSEKKPQQTLKVFAAFGGHPDPGGPYLRH